MLSAADYYERADDLWIISSYFNPADFEVKRRNCELFITTLERNGLNWLLVECQFAGRPWSLAPSPNILRVRSDSVMWQKERLLNVAIRHLPPECRKIAWLDSDILFTSPAWASDTASLLEQHPVVQPFEQVIRLPANARSYTGIGESWPSFARVFRERPQAVMRGHFRSHGHTGFAWAARLDVFEAGLFDRCVAGSGDHMMAHALVGDWESPCVSRIVGDQTPLRQDFEAWSTRVYPNVRADINYAPGVILHLWHGSRTNRRYGARNRELSEHDFDPKLDLRLNKDGCWEWGREHPALHAWMTEYFQGRNEDECLEARPQVSGEALLADVFE